MLDLWLSRGILLETGEPDLDITTAQFLDLRIYRTRGSLLICKLAVGGTTVGRYTPPSANYRRPVPSPAALPVPADFFMIFSSTLFSTFRTA